MKTRLLEHLLTKLIDVAAWVALFVVVAMLLHWL
jgi:hypothetical protein